MGILNATPDSFSDGGNLAMEQNAGVFSVSVEKALRVAETMLAEGAALLDVGGESTRPGAAQVSVQQELDRVIPVVEALTVQLGAAVSVDTSSPQVMAEAARKGAFLINDVRALQRPRALQQVAEDGLAVCLMHMQGEPDTMQAAPHYADVVDEVLAFLANRVDACLAAGIARENLLIDPGFGFGKTLQHNYLLLQQLSRLQALNLPVLVGVSRKSMLGRLLHRPVEQRLAGSIAATMYALSQGAAIIRTHDVGPTIDAIKVYAATRLAGDETAALFREK
ncbi:MAG: dihydropteroate synthase [Pseudomonadales bacterium]|nr:dihydropteroate synthase [Pseudomonadales bacterium]